MQLKNKCKFMSLISLCTIFRNIQLRDTSCLVKRQKKMLHNFTSFDWSDIQQSQHQHTLTPLNTPHSLKLSCARLATFKMMLTKRKYDSFPNHKPTRSSLFTLLHFICNSYNRQTSLHYSHWCTHLSIKSSTFFHSLRPRFQIKKKHQMKNFQYVSK